MPVVRSTWSCSTSLRYFLVAVGGSFSSSSLIISILRPALTPPTESKYSCMPLVILSPSAAYTFEYGSSTPSLRVPLEAAAVAGAVVGCATGLGASVGLAAGAVVADGLGASVGLAAGAAVGEA